MDTGTTSQEAGYVQSPNQQTQQQQQQPTQTTQEDCGILTPTLADILSDDRILRFYQCVKDIKTQGLPSQTGSMFFALCHALGDTVSFLKVPNMSKIMFRQEQQIFAVNVAGTQHDTFQQNPPPPPPQAMAPMSDNNSADMPLMAGGTADLMHDVGSTHTSHLFSAAGADGSPQHLLQAALASVTPHAVSGPVVHQVPAPTTSKRKNNENKDGTKRAKKSSPRDKEYAVRRNEVINDLLKVPEADLLHQANTVDDEVKLIIQGHERSTKHGSLDPLPRFAHFANLAAHYDCDFAPKNAGVYFNYEYFQLYLAYRDMEMEKQRQQQMEGSDPLLANSNWEAIRRRLTIGERICSVCGVVGRGFLLLSRQVSGRKLLHNFNTTEWTEFMREFERPESQQILQTLQTKYSPERFYGPRQELMMVSHPPSSQAPSNTSNNDNASIVEGMVKPNSMPPIDLSAPADVAAVDPVPDTTNENHDDDAVAAVAAAVAAAVGNTSSAASTPVVTEATAAEVNNE
ncbi:hypothetical protein CU098_010107 [Rhizopus stolonifer]|uniref:Uncharacterized protein n=1 Tax=Rhizopus stolonifer TaxID=4846 RepID=A0A367KRW7_RHIST|nr:hypothetical protein CU098_010107 [Rhizopus stolonifer]